MRRVFVIVLLNLFYPTLKVSSCRSDQICMNESCFVDFIVCLVDAFGIVVVCNCLVVVDN